MALLLTITVLTYSGRVDGICLENIGDNISDKSSAFEHNDVQRPNNSSMEYEVGNQSYSIILKLDQIELKLNSIDNQMRNSWQTFLLGLFLGFIITLIADNPFFKFKCEKFVRFILRRNLITASLYTIEMRCEGDSGILFFHGIKLTNNMLFTPVIPRAYCSSNVSLNWQDPCVYFSDTKFEFKYYKYGTLKEELDNYQKCVLRYTNDPAKRSLDIAKWTPRKVVVLVEPIDLGDKNQNIPLNHFEKVGPLHLGSRNLMPVLSPGTDVEIDISSEIYGPVERILLKIPVEEKLKPLGDSSVVMGMSNRPVVLRDIGGMLTWPARLEIIKQKQ